MAKTENSIEAKTKLYQFIESHRKLCGLKTLKDLGSKFRHVIPKSTIAAYVHGYNPIPLELWDEFSQILNLTEENYFEFIMLNLKSIDSFDMAYFLDKAKFPFRDLICSLIASIFIFNSNQDFFDGGTFYQNCLNMNGNLNKQIRDKVGIANICLNPNLSSKILPVGKDEILITFMIDGKSYSIIPTPRVNNQKKRIESLSLNNFPNILS